MNEKQLQDKINGTIWSACDTLRSSIPGGNYKDYALVMLFVKYLSDTYKEEKEKANEMYKGNEQMIERYLSRSKFILKEECTFDYLYNKRNEDNIGEIINKSLVFIALTNKSPIPGTAKTFSTTSEPVRRPAANGPKTVITGIKAFLRACFNITVALDKPFALAVIIYSEFKTSTNSVLVKRATFAIVKNDNAIDGKIVHIYLKSEPNGTPHVIGKRLNLCLGTATPQHIHRPPRIYGGLIPGVAKHRFYHP